MNKFDDPISNLKAFEEIKCVAIPNDLKDHTILLKFEVSDSIPPYKIEAHCKRIIEHFKEKFKHCDCVVMTNRDSFKLTNIEIKGKE